MTAGLPLMKSVLLAVAKSVLLPFGLPVAMSAINQELQHYYFQMKKWKI